MAHNAEIPSLPPGSWGAWQHNDEVPSLPSGLLVCGSKPAHTHTPGDAEGGVQPAPECNPHSASTETDSSQATTAKGDNGRGSDSSDGKIPRLPPGVWQQANKHMPGDAEDGVQSTPEYHPHSDSTKMDSPSQATTVKWNSSGGPDSSEYLRRAASEIDLERAKSLIDASFENMLQRFGQVMTPIAPVLRQASPRFPAWVRGLTLGHDGYPSNGVTTPGVASVQKTVDEQMIVELSRVLDIDCQEQPEDANSRECVHPSRHAKKQLRGGRGGKFRKSVRSSTAGGSIKWQ